jgi:hypothetical protein
MGVGLSVTVREGSRVDTAEVAVCLFVGAEKVDTYSGVLKGKGVVEVSEGVTEAGGNGFSRPNRRRRCPMRMPVI